ncbi:MAG: hypothetical protein RL518_1687 [Pseudomonadota bacterium]|jgi:two-component sensor histidine kinase
MSVSGLSGYSLSWVQQRGIVQARKDTHAEDKSRRASNDLQLIQQEASHEFSKDELKRMRSFMASIGERVESIDVIINNFERIDTKRKGAITAEQVNEFERSSSEAAVAPQPILLDQNDTITPMAKAPMESYLNKYTAEVQQKSSTFERSE